MVFRNMMLVTIAAKHIGRALPRQHPPYREIVGGAGCRPYHVNAGALRGFCRSSASGHP